MTSSTSKTVSMVGDGPRMSKPRCSSNTTNGDSRTREKDVSLMEVLLKRSKGLYAPSREFCLEKGRGSTAPYLLTQATLDRFSAFGHREASESLNPGWAIAVPKADKRRRINEVDFNDIVSD